MRRVVAITGGAIALAACLMAFAGVGDAAASRAAAHASRTRNSVTVKLYPETYGGLLPLPGVQQVLALLNEQRTAVGMAPVVLEPRLSEGCTSWAKSYRELKGQFPHEELSTQPGYTALGDEAAASSDLAGQPGMPGGGEVGVAWTPALNPWSDGPLHLTTLLDPTATQAWYGGTYGAACLGTGGQRTFSAPTFFSYPGNAMSNVAPEGAVHAEAPFSPAEAAGLPRATAIGSTIILWPEGVTARLVHASLLSADGAAHISVVTPETPAPEGPFYFPTSGDVGDYSGGANYLVPDSPLRPDTVYEIEAEWQPVGGGPLLKQRSNFKTGPKGTDGDKTRKALREAAEHAGLPGSYTMTKRGKRITVYGTGLAVGQVMKLREAYVVCHEYTKPFCRDVTTWHRSIRLRATSQTFSIAAPRHPDTIIDGLVSGFATPDDYIQGEGTAGIVV